MSADFALLQEAAEPPPEIANCIDVNPGPWHTVGAVANRPWRAAIARLSDGAQVEWIKSKSIQEAASGELAVSRLGTLAAAAVTPPGGAPFVLVSMYAPWSSLHASAPRVVSDLSAFIGSQQQHRILAAGDLNILYGYGESGSAYWAARYQTVFTRMEALGLCFVGPQAPLGRQADPWPAELPRIAKTCPPTTQAIRHPPQQHANWTSSSPPKVSLIPSACVP